METVVFVCTGNICRSPMAHVLLERELEERGIDAAVRSAGIRPASRGVPEQILAQMTDKGLDLTPHVTTGLDAVELSDATLVVGLDRGHVRELVSRQPELWDRTFTLKELVRRAEAIGPRAGPWRDWLDAVHEGRTASDLFGASVEDDVADPYGGSDEDYVSAADEIAELVEQFASYAWPSARRGPPT